MKEIGFRFLEGNQITGTVIKLPQRWRLGMLLLWLRFPGLHGEILSRRVEFVSLLHRLLSIQNFHLNTFKLKSSIFLSPEAREPRVSLSQY